VLRSNAQAPHKTEEVIADAPAGCDSPGGEWGQRARGAPGAPLAAGVPEAAAGPPGGFSRTSRAGTICSIFISGSLNPQPLRRALIAVASVCVAGFMPAAEIIAQWSMPLVATFTVTSRPSKV